MEIEENKYGNEHAEPEADVSGLDDIFNVAIENNQVIDMDTGEIIDEVKSMRKELKDLESDMPDIDGIILENINRANRFLDKIEDDITGDRGTYTASLIEACGRLIDSVTSAANSITGASYNSEILKQKERDLDIKEKKLLVGNIVKGAENVTVNNNSLVMNREDLMKMINEG